MKPRLRSRSFRARNGVAFFVTVVAVRLLSACGETVEVGFDDPLGSAGMPAGMGGSTALAGSMGDAGTGESLAGAPGCAPTPCRGKLYECGNCLDDDGDGQLDALDTGCLGPCDDDEAALSTGLSGTQGGNCRRDCYFDGDNGAGNDKCAWSHACDPLSAAPDFAPSGDLRCAYDDNAQVMGASCADLQAEQTQACLDSCLPVVPNGCDCFGCCELPGGSGDFRYIGLGRGSGGCQLENAADAASCPPCTPVDSCLNACEACEACVGRPAPEACDPEATCPVGRAACAPSKPCAFGEYCVTGCCIPAPEPT